MENKQDRMPWEAALRENMRRVREAADMSQTELGKRLADRGLPFHQQTIQRIESGDRPVRLNEAMIISEVLGVDLDQLVRVLSPERLTEGIQHVLENAEMDSETTHPILIQHLRTLARDLENVESARRFYLDSLGKLGRKPDRKVMTRCDRVADRLRMLIGQLDALAGKVS